MINFLNKGEVKTLDATATAADIINPKTAYVNDEKIVGSIIPTYGTSDIIQTKTLDTNSLNIDDVMFDNSLCVRINGNNLEFYGIQNDNITINNVVTHSYSEIGLPAKVKLIVFAKEKTDDTHILMCCYLENMYYATFMLDTSDLSVANVRTVAANIPSEDDGQFINALVAIPNTKNQFISGTPTWAANTGSGNGYRVFILKDITTELKFQMIAFNQGFGLATGNVSYFHGLTKDGLHFSFMLNATHGNGNHMFSFNRADINSNFIMETPGVSGWHSKGKVYLTTEYYIKNSKIYKASDNSEVGSTTIADPQRVRIFPTHTDNYFIVMTDSAMKVCSLTSTYTIKEHLSFTVAYPLLATVPSITNDGAWAKTGDIYKSPDLGNTTSNIIKLTRNDIDYLKIGEATATHQDVLEDKIYYNNTGKSVGTMPNNGALNYTPTESSQSIPAGYTSGGTVSGDANLIAGNIKAGVSIFNVLGTFGIEQLQGDMVTSGEPINTASGVTSINVVEGNYYAIAINAVSNDINATITGGEILSDTVWDNQHIAYANASIKMRLVILKATATTLTFSSTVWVVAQGLLAGETS